MNQRNHYFRLSIPVLVAGLSLLLIRPVLAEDRSTDPEVETILRERLTVLQEAAKLRREAYRSGRASFSGAGENSRGHFEKR